MAYFQGNFPRDDNELRRRKLIWAYVPLQRCWRLLFIGEHNRAEAHRINNNREPARMPQPIPPILSFDILDGEEFDAWIAFRYEHGNDEGTFAIQKGARIIVVYYLCGRHPEDFERLMQVVDNDSLEGTVSICPTVLSWQQFVDLPNHEYITVSSSESDGSSVVEVPPPQRGLHTYVPGSSSEDDVAERF